MKSPRCLLSLVSTLSFVAISLGGPLGPLPNVTSSDVGLKEGTCTVGDVVYMPGEQFPGTGPCERCACSARGVRCTHQQCEPRPGCKALHRPDHCCPTYQCECEQEGRVYGNGEKLVDPLDPCRVCYCQGGEVVCRRIACFVRDDCSPRLVPGRCCPEYDNCPLRGVTSLPSMTMTPSITPVKLETAPYPPKKTEPQITIKEITPVSEIPIITDVKIKENLPSPSIEITEYSSSKSPLITREATSEKTLNADPSKPETGTPTVVEVHSTETTSPKVKPTDDSKGVEDTPPSKITLSTQDSINSEIYPSNVPTMVTIGVPPVKNPPPPVVTASKAPIIEEEDPSLFADHNPAFPPLPDDLSVLSNHGDEIVPEPSVDTDHIPIEHAPSPEVVVASVTPSSVAESKELPMSTTTLKYYPDTSVITTEKSATAEASTVKLEETRTAAPVVKENPTVKLRSAIPTEALVRASSVEVRINQEPASMTIENEPLSLVMSTTIAAPIVTSITTDAPAITSTTIAATSVVSTTTVKDPASTAVVATSANDSSSTFIVIPEESKSIEDMSIEAPKKGDENSTEESKVSKKLVYSTQELPVPKTSEEYITEEPETPIDNVNFFATELLLPDTTIRPTESSSSQYISSTSQEQTTNSIAKSNVATEVTSQTEFSSIPIETSDQNPHEASENVSKTDSTSSSVDSLTTSDKFSSTSSEVITVSKGTENGAAENVETTEFILTPFGSSEPATDAVELIKVSGDSEKIAAIIENSDENKNALTDLIKLVSDVASISDHTEPPVTALPFASTTISDSEELIPINAGYKSKNSNFNQNSITEVPSFKSKSGTPTTKQKVVEIEDDEDGSITDFPPPDDKVEPTTRRPIIDNVSDDMPPVKTEKKDIEIITQSYVPTISRQPTKVVQETAPEESGPEPQ